jgi:hypothetical protein
MFYLLLILPHLLALAGLAAFAYYSSATEASDDDSGGWGGVQDAGPPSGPVPLPPDGMLPPQSGASPRRRLRVGERLSELYPPRPRRQHEPKHPARPRVKT